MRSFLGLLGVCVLSIATTGTPRAQTRDRNLAERVDSVFSDLARPNGPGCAVSVMSGSKLLYAKGYGMADVANRRPLTPRTPLFIASMSKQFTALAVLLLEQDGKLHLDDDVRRYLPELPDFGHPLTIRTLLTHTSGLREAMNLTYMAGWRSTDVITKEDILGLIRRQHELNHLPGEEFAYNNTGYILLAILIERVAGTSFRQFMRERIFRPLAMSDSDVREDVAQVISELAVGYWDHDPARLRAAWLPYSFSGSTGVVTTLDDLARWNANFYEAAVGGQVDLNKMITPGRLSDGTEFGYGLGLFIGTYRNYRMLSHAGSDPGYRAEMVRFPTERLSVAVLCNAFDIAPTPRALKVADIYLPTNEPLTVSNSNVPDQRTNTERNNMAAAFAGLYFNDSVAQTRRFFYDQGKLMLDGGGEGRFELRVLGEGRYQLTAAPRRYIFTFSMRGRTGVLEEDIEGSPKREYERVREMQPTVKILNRLAGRYYSEELDVTWNFVLRDRALVLERQRMKPTTLTPVFGEVFQAENFFVLDFRHDKTGMPFVLVSTERARRVRFIRVRSPRG